MVPVEVPAPVRTTENSSAMVSWGFGPSRTSWHFVSKSGSSLRVVTCKHGDPMHRGGQAEEPAARTNAGTDTDLSLWPTPPTTSMPTGSSAAPTVSCGDAAPTATSPGRPWRPPGPGGGSCPQRETPNVLLLFSSANTSCCPSRPAPAGKRTVEHLNVICWSSARCSRGPRRCATAR